MAKVGDKFIIEIDEVFHGDVVEDTAIYEDHELYRIKGYSSLVFDENGLNKLEKYEESSFTQEDCDMARSEGYQEGLNDAWEATETILNMSPDEINKCFDFYSGNQADVFEMTVAGAIAKIKAYEEQKKSEDEIKVGDEVYLLDKSHCLVITDVCGDKYVAISACGKYGCGFIHELKKTGRHFPQIAEVLEKMKK